MDDKELKRFEKYERFQKKDKQASKKAKAVRHPIKLSKFKAHEYKQYAIKHRDQFEYGPDMTAKEGWQTIGQLISKWTPIQKCIAIVVILIFISIVVSAFFAV